MKLINIKKLKKIRYPVKDIIDLLKEGDFIETLEAILETMNEEDSKTYKWPGYGIHVRSYEKLPHKITSTKHDYSDPSLFINFEVFGRGYGELKTRSFLLHESIPIKELREMIEEWEKKHPCK